MTQPVPVRRAAAHRPLLLDLFCCAGGAATGYHRAGFDVVGIDIVHRPNYPFTFHRADALTFLADLITTGEINRFAFVHGSPPCQAGCALTVGTNASRGWGRTHVQLIPALRDLLEATDLPYVIEQPTGKAPIRRDLTLCGLTLCGESFGLGVLRHRVFELGRWSTVQPPHPRHRGPVRGYRHGVYREGPYVAAYGSGGGKATVPEMQAAMGITWTNVREELTEAIPPAYTQHIGTAFLASTRTLEVAA
ncbi:DNA methylase [Streptomyces sp. NPDC059740]|uniref:DNA methylase n=1 Tax=Streptomyces sp. NPDC059740 TaxID=3346926 RepID=UPI00365D731C